MNGGRGKRSRELAAKLAFYLFYIDRVIIFANIVQIIFHVLSLFIYIYIYYFALILITFEKSCTITSIDSEIN